MMAADLCSARSTRLPVRDVPADVAGKSPTSCDAPIDDEAAEKSDLEGTKVFAVQEMICIPIVIPAELAHQRGYSNIYFDTRNVLSSARHRTYNAGQG